MVQEASVTKAAVCMGVKETGMLTGTGAHTNGLQVRIENRYVCSHCGAIRRALVCCKMEIDWEKRGWEPSGPRSAS